MVEIYREVIKIGEIYPFQFKELLHSLVIDHQKEKGEAKYKWS